MLKFAALRRLLALATGLGILASAMVIASTLDPSGDLDTSFDSDGKTQHNFGTTLVPADSRALIVQPSGKIVVGGGSNNGLYKEYVVARLNTNGTTDTGFGEGAFGTSGVTVTDMGFDDRILALAQNSSGARFCGGGISSALFGVACYTADGLPDTSFNAGANPVGTSKDNAPASINGGSNVGRIEGMTFDRNDRLIAVGWGDFQPGLTREWVIRRWNTNGTPDTSFGNQGWVVIDHGGSDRAFDVAIIKGATIAQDIIVVTGTRSTPSPRGVITLLNMDGSLYTTSNQITGTTGKGYYGPGGTTQFRGVAVQSDNDHIVVTGQGAGFLVHRFALSNNTVQTSANLGINTNDVGFRVRIATHAGNERVYASGTNNDGTDFRVARLPLNLGAAEYAATTSLSAGSDFAQDLAIDTNNGFVTVTGTAQSDLNTVVVARYNASGTLDTGFNSSGALPGTYYAQITGGSTDESKAFGVQSDGKMVVAGTTFNSSGDYDVLVTRVNTDGTRDAANWGAAFPTPGWHTYGFSAGSAENVHPGGVAIDGNGKAVVVGTTGSNYFAIRYNTNGTLDSGFDGDGILSGNWGANTSGKVVAIDASNNIIVGGEITLNGDWKLSRLAASNGALDSGFGSSGTATIDVVSGRSDVLKALAVDANGKIVGAGQCISSGGVSKMCLARLNANGSLDASFDGDGKVFLNISGSDTFDLRSMQLLPDLDTANATDYKIVAAGQFVQSSPSQSMWLVARFNHNGALDTTFDGDGYKTFTAGPSTNIGAANSIAVQHDEKLVVFGETSVVDPMNPGFYLFRKTTVVRLNWDGSLDTTYGSNGFVYASQGSDPGESYQGYIYPQSNAGLKGRALSTNFIIGGDFAFTRYREDPSPIAGASVPDLAAASDAGRSSTDNITNDTTPTFTGTCSEGETVHLLVNSAPTQPRTRQVCGAAGTYALTPTLSGVPRTSYDITTRTQSGIGDSAVSSPALQVMVDAEINPVLVISNPTAGSNQVPNVSVDGTSEAVANVVVTTNHPQGGGCGAGVLANGSANGAGSGSWLCSNTAFKQGAHTVSAVQTDLAGNIASAVTRSFSVKVPTSTGIVSSVNPSKYGQSVSFTATVTPGLNADLSLHGTTVRFVEGGTTLATVPLTAAGVGAAGTAIFTPSGLGLSVGLHTIEAVYDENANWLGSSAQVVQEVQKADTTTSVTSPTNPTVFGQTAMFVATVSAVSPGAGVPGGNVAFVVDGVAQAPVALDGSGQASYGSSALTVGSHSVVVNYLGDASYNPSNGALAGGHTVNRAATATGLVSALNPSTRGASVTFTATVSAVAPGAGTRTGMVDFFLDGAAMPSASVAVNAAGVASFNTSALSVGPHTLTASYAGDGNFLGSSGTLVPAQTVNKAASGTVVVSSLNPSTFGQGVTFTATVSAVAPSTDVPTGSVDFVIDGTPQSVALNGSGVATLATASLSAGNHTVQVDYAGDANLSSSSGTLAGGQVVNPAATTTTLSSSGSPTVFGQSVSFTATVAVTGAGVGTPSGTVQFVIDGGAPQPVALDGSGVATLSTSTLGVGSHTVAANYGASTNFSASNGTLGGGHVVNRGETTIVVGSSADPSVFGQNVTFTATVAPTAPAAGTPGGTVTFTIDGGAPSAPVALVGGQAQMSTSALAVGPHRIEVSYSGDGNFNTSNGAFDPQTVNRAATAAAVESATNPATLGQNVVFTATISPSAPGAGTPSGTVQFFFDGAVTPTATQALSGGVASYSSSALTVGTHSLSVTYSGDGNFTGSSANLTPDQTVNKNPSSTSLTTSLSPSPFADPLTFTATVTPVNPGPVATGTVHFVIDGGAPQPVGLDASGVATLTTSMLSGGSHSVVAQYQGDANLEVSSATLTPAQAITAATTSTAITSNANPASFGQTVDFTASVSATRPAAGTPNGTVQFVIDGGAPQLVALNGAGQATLSTNLLAVGNHSVSANYVGTSSYATSSASLSPQQTINEAASSTTLSSSANPAAQGASITWTATVAAVPPASGTPSGAVHFVIDGNSTGPITLVGGVASFSSAALTPGPHTVVANYDGADANFLGSSGTLTPDQVVFPVDLGDAPAPYPTLSAHNGARHHAQGPRLGTVDSESDGVPSTLADGDDLNGGDDEDGVSFAGALIPGQNAALTVTASATAKLDGWIDFNNDGDWADLGEQVFAAHSLVASANALSLAVPASTVADSHVFARFRVSSAGGLAVDGFAADGEVEDYRLATSPVVDLQVSQSESIDPVVAGSGVGNLVYTVTVSNQGPSAASGIALSENLTLPAGTSLVSAVPSQGSYAAGTWTLGSLALNASATMTLTLTVDGSTVPASDAICSAAAVSAVIEPRLNPGDDSSTSCTSVTRQVDLALSQTESVDPVLAGSGASNLSYVLNVANAGPSAASAVVIGEVLTLPAGVSLASATPSQGSFAGSTWTLGTLAVGSSATLTLNLTVAANAAVGSDTICAAASISSLGESLINPGNDSASTCSSVSRQIDLQVDKTDSIEPVGAGSGSGNLVQTVSVHNLGVSDASGVVLSEAISLPAGVSTDSIVPSHGSYAAGTWTLGDLAAQASATLTVTYTVSAGAVAGDQICDTATVTASNEPRTNTGDDSATECTSIVRQTDLSLSKVADVSAIGAGQSITYTLTATNHGPGDATGVVVSDTLPAALSVTSSSGCAEPLGVPVCTLGAIANGASKSFTVTVTVNPAPPGLIVNTASVSGAEPDPSSGNNSASATVSTDTIAPTLVLDSLGATADGVLRSCETILHPVDGATIQFSEAMFDPPGHNSPGDVSNPAHYRLLRAAPGALFSSHQCSDPPGSDVVIPLGVAYDAGLHQAVLQFGALRDGIHRLLLCGDLVDTANNAIVGDSGPGSDVVRSFRVDQKNWLAAGHFDTYDAIACASTPWTSSAPTALTLSAPPDAEGSPLSGSAHNTGSSTGFDLGQCAALPPGHRQARLQSALRIDAAPGTLLRATPTCTYYAQPDCAGAAIGETSAPVLIGQTANQFLRFDQATAVPAGAASVYCQFTLARATGSTFNAYLDQLHLGPETLFGDSFE